MSFGPTTQVLPIRERIADTLRAMRLSAKEIAHKANVSPRSVENWRAANASMSIEALAALCREHDDLWAEFCAICGRPSTVEEAAQIMDDFRAWRKERNNAG